MSAPAASPELPKGYEPQQVEARWYDVWDQAGYFHAEPQPGRPSYCITIPPPNVTGELHMGHALQHALHDALIRWKRMSGFNTLCVPGTDHAGIGTQRLVERALAAEGLNKYDLGRERFLERMWAWTEQYGNTILGQLRTLGCSYDWRRTRFTLDEGYVKAVLRSFVDYYERGWIYRGDRITNWCPSCQTALSDLEVDHEDVTGNLWHLRYPFTDGNGHVTVATTRPETMLGDTAVAIHPKDPRHEGEAGRTVRLPLMERDIPVIADPILVDPEFGSGAVKVTPAHDPNDYECGIRHHLPQLSVIGKDGSMTEAAGPYAGLDRFEARRRVVADLDARGLLDHVEEYIHAVGHCERCRTIVEPLLSEQWYVKMEELAREAAAAIEDERMRFIPERYAAPTVEYLHGIRDWCISRQLWWGHRIPIYTCAAGHECASVETPDACAVCGDSTLTQDPDVLDTWFSSALWPFAVLGWPEPTPELEAFYPTSLLITDRQIIRLWVIRMLYSSLHFRGVVPFPDCYIHATVLTRDGRRMSKSKGTGVDPMDLIGKYGADATRFGLLQMASKGQDIRFTEERMEGARFFCNKLWNASRFALMHLGGGQPLHRDPNLMRLEDRWLASRLSATVEAVYVALADYNLDDAANAIYEFTWNELCDWYLELAKPRLQAGGDDAAHVRALLAETLETTLRLLHPFMPFITEEIWSALRDALGQGDAWGPSVMVAPFPVAEAGARDADAEAKFARMMERTQAVRRLRAEAKVPPGQRVKVALVVAEGTTLAPEEADALSGCLSTLARAEVEWIERDQAPQPSLSDLAAGVEAYLPLTGLVDVEKEAAKLRAEMASVEKELARVQGKLANEQFLARAPEAVVEKERGILAELEGRRQAAQERLTALNAAV